MKPYFQDIVKNVESIQKVMNDEIDDFILMEDVFDICSFDDNEFSIFLEAFNDGFFQMYNHFISTSKNKNDAINEFNSWRVKNKFFETLKNELLDKSNFKIYESFEEGSDKYYNPTGDFIHSYTIMYVPKLKSFPLINYDWIDEHEVSYGKNNIYIFNEEAADTLNGFNFDNLEDFLNFIKEY